VPPERITGPHMPEAVRSSTGAVGRRTRDLAPMVAMMGLFFLVVCAVGILRPIKNALALDGLGETDFYKVYLVSAGVVLFVPLYNRMADRVPWRWLIPSVALFFAANLVLFRAFYVEGSTSFGLVFYGWYDLFAAALVTQFFMATQLFFNARTAKQAYPIVIAGGSIGATMGGAITGFFAERVGTPNLLLVASALIVLFSIGMPIVWRAGEAVAASARRRRPDREKVSKGELRALIKNPHIRLIALMVLLTVLVKQLVDYQFNTLTKEVFQERDAISAFQGKFNAATQWLPLVALAVLQPALRRYGMAVAVLMLPAAMLLTNFGLVIFGGLWAAVAAKGAETSLRYSAERAGREILYVPVPEDVKLKAKAYIDVAVEKGIGKVSSAVLIAVLLTFMNYRTTVWVGLGLSILWFGLALTVRREYVRTLAHSIEGRFASLRGLFISLFDATTIPVVRNALTEGDPLRTAFALDLVDQAPARDVRVLAPELNALLAHDSAELRARALGLLGRMPDAADVDAIRARMLDPVPAVREAAVRALHQLHAEEPRGVLEELLGSQEARVRTATLACLARGELGDASLAIARKAYAVRRALPDGKDPEARVELALAAGTLGDDDAVAMLTPFLDDPDPRVASTALRSAGLLERAELYPRMVRGLAHPATRSAARDALVLQGERIVPYLADRLLDERGDRAVRRSIPAVLARIPLERTVETLLRSALATETDQLLDYRTLKALSKLRAHHAQLRFDAALVDQLAQRETEAARSYASAWAALAGAGEARTELLRRALIEAWRERRETSFRALGLVQPPDDMYRCYLAVTSGEAVPHANALEWLENTLGYAAFRRLSPVLEEPTATASVPDRAARTRQLERLAEDEDAWIAHCARAASAELASANGAEPPFGSKAMDMIEKVFLLQKVDLLRDARSAHLADLASIAEEIDVPRGTVLMREGEPTDALYVVVRGAVELKGMGGTLLATDGTAFGTWALIDQAPSIVEGSAAEDSHLLRITRDEFHDLIGDHPELAIGLLQGLARRVRTLVA
jgi:AAA family ATP:ADP antiporter